MRGKTKFTQEQLNESVKNRFWKFVKKSDGDECWIWLGGRSNNGSRARFGVGDETTTANI